MKRLAALLCLIAAPAFADYDRKEWKKPNPDAA